MKGLELSKRFFEECGRPLFEREIPELMDRMAFGLVGEGSECFGFDDEVSRDHDFEPGFCVWLTDEDYERFGFRLERLYASLPKEFRGFRRQMLSPVGGNRHGIMTISGFYSRFLGSDTAPKTLEHWLYLPEYALASATNGRVFEDVLGVFSDVRGTLLSGYPKDVRLKKMAAHAILLFQGGLYNYERCIRHGERGAAQLAVFEFVDHALSLIYLLNNRYRPFYKWAYRAMRALPLLSELEMPLVTLTVKGNEVSDVKEKLNIMEEIGTYLLKALHQEGWLSAPAANMEEAAYALQGKIPAESLRNMHIMEGV